MSVEHTTHNLQMSVSSFYKVYTSDVAILLDPPPPPPPPPPPLSIAFFMFLSILNTSLPPHLNLFRDVLIKITTLQIPSFFSILLFGGSQYIPNRFLHQNLISRIENIGHLQHLDTLNLSNNSIYRLENLREYVLLSLVPRPSPLPCTFYAA